MEAVAVAALLARTPGLQARHVHSLVSAAGGDLERAVEPRTLAQVSLPASTRAFLARHDITSLREDLRWIQDSGARLLTSADPDFPPQLRAISRCPPVLFVLGDGAVLTSSQLAMVGSRNPTPSGLRTAREFGRVFATAGLVITSGLAEGIDAASHEGALQAGRTVAVCGTGLDEIYPARHRTLAGRIREQGALVSHFPPRTRPRGANFVQRNRLISGLSIATLVVEAAPRSGSLWTARHACAQGRPLFAVPGSIYSATSRGCHLLIQNGATLAQDPAEVLSQLKFKFDKQILTSSKAPPGARPALDKEYEMLLDALGFEPATVDVLAARTGLAAEAIASMLLILELEGHVATSPGGRFGRIS